MSDEVGLIQPFVLVRLDDRGRHLLQVPPPDFAGVVIDIGSVHPSGGLHQDIIPIALEGNVELHHHDGEGVVLQRAGEPLSAGQTQRFARLDNGRLLEANILRSPARKNAPHRPGPRAEELPKPLEVDGLADVVEEKQPETPAQEHNDLLA